MAVRVGWSLTRPRERKPGQIGHGIQPFRIINIGKGRGAFIIAGTLTFDREDLEILQERGTQVGVWVLGRLTFASDVRPALVKDTIRSVTTIGKLRASPDIKRALAD